MKCEEKILSESRFFELIIIFYLIEKSQYFAKYDLRSVFKKILSSNNFISWENDKIQR